MPTIMAMIGDEMKRIEDDVSEGTRNADRAVAAIIGGINSVAWETYMQVYASTPAQLSRLLATDGTLGNPEQDKKRAYLVGNAVCGQPTRNDLARDVATIDDNVPNP